MANDPAFLFYPGDYLRDTQCLSERSQVAYDRIMCEHMRNICISQAQLDFFTKRLTPDEKSEILMVLAPVKGGFHIPWVTESITKRREYSDSRRKNREGKPKKEKNISSSYVPHMENEIENVNEIENTIKDAFDDIYLEQQKIKWPHIDFDFEYRSFCEKVRGSPAYYKKHDSGGLRLAFQSQLRYAKKKNNGGLDKKATEIISRRAAFAERHSSDTGQ